MSCKVWKAPEKLAHPSILKSFVGRLFAFNILESISIGLSPIVREKERENRRDIEITKQRHTRIHCKDNIVLG